MREVWLFGAAEAATTQRRVGCVDSVVELIVKPIGIVEMKT